MDQYNINFVVNLLRDASKQQGICEDRRWYSQSRGFRILADNCAGLLQTNFFLECPENKVLAMAEIFTRELESEICNEVNNLERLETQKVVFKAVCDMIERNVRNTVVNT